jgi:hypothetical protein
MNRFAQNCFHFFASLLVFFLFNGNLRAEGLRDVIVLEMSSTQKSISVDIGTRDEFKEGIYAKFFVQSQNYKFPKIFLVAEGKLIKSFPKKSFWYLSKVYLPRFMYENVHLQILTSLDVKSGRKLSIKKKHLVLPSDQYESVDDYFDKNGNVIPNRLVQIESEYEKSQPLFVDDKFVDGDVQVTSYEVMRNRSGYHLSEEYDDLKLEKYFIGGKEYELGDVEYDQDKKLLDSMAAGIVNKYNSQKFELAKGLYSFSEKDPNIKEINKKLSVTSTYDTLKEEKKAKDQISPTILEKIRRDGDLWSADMDDETLRRYFITSGLEKEKRRRELALNELDGHEIIFHYAGNLRSQSKSSDNSYRALGYSFTLGYDLHLSRLSPNIKNWSIEFMIEQGIADYDIGSLNGRMSESYFGGYINYYFYNNPLTLNSLIVMGGVGIKSGTAGVSATGLTKEYSYQVLTNPALQLMTKYRFKAGDGTEETVNVGASINAGLALESKTMSVLESVNTEDNIYSSKTYDDFKYIIGLSIFF